MPLDNAIRPTLLSLATATVRQAEPLTLSLDGLETAATRAPGCLLAPLAGDDVLVLRTATGCVLLHVVARDGGAAAVLDHPAGIELRAPRLSLQAGESLAVHAPAAVLDSGSLTLRAATANVVVRSANLVADALRTVAARIEQAATHLATNTANRVSVVTGMDTLDAHAVHTKVETTLSAQAGTVVVLADTDIKMDAERISLG